MVKWPRIPIPFENIMRGHRLTNASERIYDFICQEQQIFVSQQNIVDDEQKRPVVVGLNSGKDIVEILKEEHEEDSNAPYFSLLSVGPDKEAEWALDRDIDKPNVDYNPDDRLVILVDSEIKTGERAYLALKELYRVNRPKCVRLAVIDNYTELRTYPLQPDKVIK